MRLPACALLAGALFTAACSRTPDPADGSDAQGPAAPAATVPTDPTPGAAAQPKTGTPDAGAPIDLAITTLDGAEWNLVSRRGRWVVVNFWATWCAPCLKEMPELSALDAAREHVEVLGLAYEEIEPDEMRAFLAQRPVVYPIAIVDVAAPPAAFETPRGLPMTYLVGPDGRVAKQFLGPVTAREIEDAIAAAGGPAAT